MKNKNEKSNRRTNERHSSEKKRTPNTQRTEMNTEHCDGDEHANREADRV